MSDLLPKVELHRHLEGSIRLSTLAELEPTCEGDVDKARSHFCITSPISSLTECMEVFGRLQGVFGSKGKEGGHEVIARIAREVVEDAIADNIVLLELRYSPGYIAASPGLEDGLSIHDVHAAVMEGISSAVSSSAVCVVGLIGIVDRFSTPDQAAEAMDLFISSGDFVGVDLANDETKYADSLFPDLFQAARSAGLGVTIHCGEVAYPGAGQAVVAAHGLQGATRIGHGIQVVSDESAVEAARQAGLVFEVSLSSNILTSAAPPDPALHPVRDMMDAGLAVVFCSDDPGLFDITLSHEYDLLMSHCSLTPADLAQANLAALAASFLPQHATAPVLPILHQALESATATPV